MEEQKIKQDAICIGANIRRLRLEKHVGQTDWYGFYSWRASP